MMQYAEIGDDVYFWFAANTTAGTAGDGATPLYDVRLAGAAAGAAPVQSGTPTLLTHADYPDGIHEIKVDTDAFAAGEYAVFCSLTISTVNPAGFCGSFKLRTAGTAALNVNASHVGGTAQTGRDLGASVLLSSGTGAGQLDFTSGVVKANLAQYMGTAFGGTAAQIVAAFQKLFDVASPQLTAASKDQTGDSYAIVNHADYGNAKLVRSTTPANTLTVDASHLVAVPATQDVNAKTVTNGAISNATFNADVGSTAYATNIIALAVRKVLDELKLDHLIAVAESDDPVDNSIIAKLAATGGDWSTFVGSTDSLQGIRDRGDAVWVTATGFAVAGDEMKLEDDAIKAAKFDELTAFPLKAADTGATILARAGDEMDLVDAPNETAVTAIQNGLSTFDSTSDGVTLTTGGIDAIFDRNSSLSISFETLINRIYQMINDKMEVTNESGDVVLRNIADSADIATGNVTDNSTTTVRTGLIWV